MEEKEIQKIRKKIKKKSKSVNLADKYKLDSDLDNVAPLDLAGLEDVDDLFI